MKKRTNFTDLIQLWGFIFLIGIGGSIIIFDIVISYRDFNFRAEQMRTDYSASQKQMIKQEVEHVVDMIHYEKARSEILTKTKIKSRVYEAYAIAQHIYQVNKNAKSEHEIQQMIIDAISPIRFEKGNGYYFISRFDGVGILFPSKPELQGVNLLDVRDNNGQYITKDMIKIVKQSGEGFYEYHWIKPHAAGNDFKKISFIKRFGFYDWFIGTGFYVDDVEGQIKVDLLSTISRIRFEKEGYIFVNRLNGDALVSNGQLLSGEKKLWEVFNKNPVKMKNIFEKEYNAALKPKGDYIFYSHIKLTDPNKESPKVSFIYGIPELQWLVGAGVYLDDVETVIARLQAELNNQIKMKMLYFTLIAGGIVVFFLFLFSRLNHRLKKDFNLFASFFKRAAVSDEAIDRDKVQFDELDRMAENANRMLADRRQAEESVRESEERYRLLYDGITDAIYVHEVSPAKPGKFLDVNDAACGMLGYTKEEFLQMEVNNIDAPEQAEKIPLIQKKLLRDRHVLFETHHVAKDGRRIPVEINIRLTEWMGKPMVLSVARDITERKQAEEAIRQSEAELHDNYFAQSAINMMLSESLEDRPLEEILQKALNMILSVPWLSFESKGSIHLVEGEPGILSMKAQYNLPEELKNLCANVSFGKCLCGRAALTQKIEFADHIDERHETCYEGIAPHGHYIVPIMFGGRTLGVIDIYLKEGHIRDQREEEFLITVADTLAGIIVRKQIEEEQKKLHAHLLQAQKMEAVGQLAGGVAHDFNNILTAMIGYGHLLKMKLKDEDPLRSYADHILTLSDKAANLTQSLLAFSRKQIIDPRPIDLNEIIRRIGHLLTRIIGEDIRLQTMLTEKDLIVMADPGQIEQVLMNLATNAKDAMPEGGLLTIQTETEDIGHEFIRDHGFGKEGSYALVTITDTGTGMDRKTGKKIFEPFFTTKEVGKGTGLGLSMAYGIIKQHDGYINVYSEPGRGTTFRIYLPLIEAKVEEVIHEEAVPTIVTGTETVLLAEDEIELRELTKRILEEYGYQVITAADGQNAIDEFKVHKNEIQLVLLDVIMPNKSGKEVYEEIKQIKSDIKVLFMSGHPAEVIHKQGILEKGFAYIKKPASPTKLLRKIREVLNE